MLLLAVLACIGIVVVIAIMAIGDTAVFNAYIRDLRRRLKTKKIKR